MASDVATVLLSIIGIGVIVIGVLVLMEMQTQKKEVESRVVEIVPRWRRWAPYGPYYSHLPRPILY
jgi:hypothetical protein